MSQFRRNKTAFLSEWCKEIDENNRMGNTRDVFKKIRDIKRIFHVKTGTIKNKNDKNLTEAEEINKRWKEYTVELYKKGLIDQGNHDDMVTYLELDILECEVKWTLGSISTNKAREVMEFQLSYFKS